MYGLGWENWARLFGWLLVGLVIYFSYGRRRSHLALDAVEPDGASGPSAAE